MEGRGMVSRNYDLKVSKFCQLIDCDQYEIAINSLHRSIVYLDKGMWNALQSHHTIKKAMLTTEDIELLKLAKVLVRKNIDEFELFKDWLENIKRDTSNIKATLALTSRCNFNCSYCFENGYLKKFPSDMTRKTARAIISWLRTFVLENRSQKIRTYFYGGEPTLKIDLIDYLTKEFESVFNPLEVETEFYMFTNGAILTKRLLNIIETHNFRELQITLDGPTHIHDRRRTFKNGKETFDIIFQNIKKILKETNTKVLLLVNFDRENQRDILRLLDLFVKEGLVENVQFAYNPVFQTQHNKIHCGQFSLSEAETYNTWKDLYIATLEKGLNCAPLRIFETGPCSYRRMSHFNFDPEGNIYKCIGFLGVKEFKVGNVNEEFSITAKKIEKQVFSEPWHNEKCINCIFLPLCLGGCRFHSYVEYGNVGDLFCHRSLIENVEIQLIKYLFQNRKEPVRKPSLTLR